jgi:hypothetical protein
MNPIVSIGHIEHQLTLIGLARGIASDRNIVRRTEGGYAQLLADMQWRYRSDSVPKKRQPLESGITERDIPN